LCKFSKPWYIQKFNFLFEKEISLDFGPSGPAPPAQPTTPRRPPAPRSAHSAQAALAYLLKDVFFDIAHSGRDAFSLSRHCHVGPACQLHPLPHAGRLLPLRLVASGRLAPPSDAARAPPPLNPPLNLAPINGVKAINAAVTPPGHPSLALPGPYKRAMRPWLSPHLPTTLFPLSRSTSTAAAELFLLRRFPHRRPVATTPPELR
jgi:hypothetical protein